MSFVLDALKLSEKRHSRFARPVYAHPPPVHRRGRRRRWLAALIAAPIVAGVFLAWRLVAPPSLAPPGEPAKLAKMSAAASATPGEEPPVAAVPIPATVAEPPPEMPPEVRAEKLPLEVAPPHWPALTLQMLFYSTNSDRSFVQINGRNYRVGERLDDGPEVLTIARDGVILTHQGATVRLAMER